MKITKHYNDNKKVIDFYIETNARLQEGMDLLKPFIEFYNEQGYTLSPHCPDCLIDMLRYCRKEINESTKTNETTESIETTEAPNKKKK